MLPKPQEWCSALTSYDLASETARGALIVFQNVLAMRRRIVMKEMEHRRVLSKLIKVESELAEAKKLVSERENLIKEKEALATERDAAVQAKDAIVREKEEALKSLQESYDALHEPKLDMEEELELKTRAHLLKEFLDGKSLTWEAQKEVDRFLAAGGSLADLGVGIKADVHDSTADSLGTTVVPNDDVVVETTPFPTTGDDMTPAQ